MKLKALAFDVFGTVFDFAGVDHGEIRSYGDQLRQDPWRPLQLPESWRTLPAHPDAQEGLARLRAKFVCVTLSNGPADLLIDLNRLNGLEWDGIVPIQLQHVYKPKRGAYYAAVDMLGVSTREIGMVTANPTFGDVEASEAIGMVPLVIRNEGHPADMIELAQELGA